MKTILACVVALGLVATVLLEDAFARGPGGAMRGAAAGRAGAGPRPGGAAAGTQQVHRSPQNLAPANAQNLGQHLGITPSEASSTFSQAAAQWGARPEPFTPAWYAEHPHAWQYTHPHADVFVAASATAVATWLAVPVTGYGGSSNTTIIEQSSEEPATEPVATEAPIDSAVEPGEVDSGRWMSLGAFALTPPGQTQATRWIQLAVARDGTLRGSYYDLISDEGQSIQGSVDKAYGQASWTVGSKSAVTFETSLEELTKPEGSVTVQFADGTTATWQLSQVRK